MGDGVTPASVPRLLAYAGPPPELKPPKPPLPPKPPELPKPPKPPKPPMPPEPPRGNGVPHPPRPTTGLAAQDGMAQDGGQQGIQQDMMDLEEEQEKRGPKMNGGRWEEVIIYALLICMRSGSLMLSFMA